MPWPFQPKPVTPDFVARSRHFCMMPWVHLHVTQQGTVTPCCQAPWDEKHAFGNVNRQSIGEIWSGKAMQSFRKRMRRDLPDARCTRCYEKEASGWPSLRQVTNADYLHHLSRTGDVRLDHPAAASGAGYQPAQSPVYLDIRFSNLCNLKCRICGPWSSSQWHSDAVALGMVPAGSPALSHAATDEEALFAQLTPLLDTVEEIYFAGGEPLFMDQHYRLLDMLLARGRTDVRLKYNTNFSRLDLKGRRVTDYWKQFRHVSLAASLDAAGARGEYLRKNLNWGAVEALRQMLRVEVPHVHFFLSPTVYAFNLLHLPDFHRDWAERGLIAAGDCFPSLLIQPEAYNIRVLPEAVKAGARMRYGAHIAWLEGHAVGGDSLRESIHRYRAVLAHLDAGDHSYLLGELRARTARLDRLRGEEARGVFPELGEVFE